MQKYELKNIPNTGVKFEVANRRAIILDEHLMDEDAEFLLDDGKNSNAAHYIKLKEIPPIIESKVVTTAKSKEV